MTKQTIVTADNYKKMTKYEKEQHENEVRLELIKNGLLKPNENEELVIPK